MIALNIGYFAEGATDERFYKMIIQRSFEQLFRSHKKSIMVNAPDYLGKGTRENIQQVLEGLEETGYDIFCIHTDCDKQKPEAARNSRIHPLLPLFEDAKIVVPIVPIHMTEAWLLADKALLKEQLGTDKSDQELGIARKPETIANPKVCLNEAIRKAEAHQTKRQRRRGRKLGELYEDISRDIDLQQLERLKAYQQFIEDLTKALQHIHLL